MNSCSPKRRPTAKMRSSRISLAKARDPFFQPLDGIAQLRNRRAQRFELRTPHQQGACLAGVTGEAVGEATQCIGLPGRKIAPGLHHAARGDVADEPGEVLLHVPAQVSHQRHDLGCEPRLASHLDRAHEMLGSAREAPERFRPQRDNQHRLGPARLHAPGRQYRQAHGGQGWRAQLEALAGEGRESLARPGLGVEQMIQSKTKGHRGGGLFARQATPQCICWMPASSQPPEPSAGFTRFHTSSKPTGAVPGVSRTMPEKRTLAQCLLFSVATSSRSALSATTSVCCTSERVRTSRRSSSNISRVVNSRISSTSPTSLATCSFTKLSLATRRKPAASKPAGTAPPGAATLAPCAGSGPATACAPRSAAAYCIACEGATARRRASARNASTTPTASSASRSTAPSPLPLKR